MPSPVWFTVTVTPGMMKASMLPLVAHHTERWTANASESCIYLKDTLSSHHGQGIANNV
jgi:hypothetical protein